MAARYWVGGTASWDATAGTKWATTSGGAGGASVPTSADDVFFDAASGAVTVTISTATCKTISCTGFTGTITGSGAFTIAGSVTLVSGMTYTHTGTATITGTGTLTTAGKTFSALTVLGSGITVTLADALTTRAGGGITVTQGGFDTGGYTVTSATFDASNSNTRTISLGSSTLFVSTVNFATSTGLTFLPGTSQINITTNGVTVAGGGQTFYNVALTNTNTSTMNVTGSNTFNNFSVVAPSTAGVTQVTFDSGQTINGTLTLSAGTNATMRTFVSSNTIGTTRTLTCAAFSGTDADFRDITITGAAAPVSGTRLGDCKGNSGITFDAGVSKYWNLAAGGNWSATGWATTGGGTPAANNFPLAQDTAVFQSTGLNSGARVTINANYNIGTIDMSARTTNTMTLATGSTTPLIYGDWVNGTGTTLSGVGVLRFTGRGAQKITNAGRTWTQPLFIDVVSGSVTLQDALTSSFASNGSLTLLSGTFNANNYNLTFSGANSQVSVTGTATRTLALGSGTWTIAGTTGGPWNATTSTNLTVTGTGTISLTSASAKTFTGGGIQTYPTINQGGAGTLTITGSNKFANITNTAIGRVQFTGGTTNEFTAFNLNGAAGNLLQLGSTNTTQAILKKPSAWYMGANSTDGGNNTGLTFTAGGGIDYLSVSYINGQISAGGATHTTTGALTGPGSAITGSSTRFRVFDTAGTLVGSGSTVLGLTTRFRAFGTSGTLVGAGAAITGSSVRFRAFNTTGALTGAGSAITGDANRFRAFNTTGSLAGAGSLISGNARRYRVFDATGAIPGVAAEIVGTARVSVTHTTAGVLTGAGAELTGASVLIKLYPDPSDVREGVQYGPGGMYVGTLTVVDGQTIIRIRSITERL